MSEMGKVVCVTGASGYIASWLVKFLLQRGYTVKGTVRNLSWCSFISFVLFHIHREDFTMCLNFGILLLPDIFLGFFQQIASDPKKVAHLKALEGANERLHLFEANLIEEGSFDSVIDGCEGVFHTASPVFLTVTDPQTELIDPAVKGTLNVLRSCKKVASVKRVVITSSMASVMFNANPLKPDVIVDETWYSDPVFCKEKNEWYGLSKILAEKAAWKFVEENDLDIVTLHPGFVIGPLLQPTLNFTTEAFLNLIKEGKQLFVSGVYRYVDVRDVAHAHILAFENSSANGRYCLVGRLMHSSEALKILSGIFPSLNLPANNTENQPAFPPYQVSKERAKGLGVEFTPVEVSFKDTVQCLKDKNLLSF